MKFTSLKYARPWIGALGIVVGLAGCSSSGDDGSTPMNDTPQGNGTIESAAAVGQNLSTPFDAQPSPDADAVYFTANTAVDAEDSSGALFMVGANGGAPQMLAEGFNAPLGLIVSTDGSAIYVADVSVQKETEDMDDDRVGGVIYSVSSSGGTPTELASTVGYRARSMDLVEENGADVIYFSGNDPADMAPGVFKVGTGGGAVETIVKGDELSDPSGVAVAADGTIYVADTSGADDSSGAVLRISGSTVTKLIDGIDVGYPAGIALTQDEKFLLVSGHVENGVQAAVFRVDLATGEATAVTMGLEGNTASGGVHRAKNADTYAWSNADFPDFNGAGGGSVYIITTSLPIAR